MQEDNGHGQKLHNKHYDNRNTVICKTKTIDQDNKCLRTSKETHCKPWHSVTHFPSVVMNDPSGQKHPPSHPSFPSGESQVGGIRGPQVLYSIPLSHGGTR